jgi:ComEC/Rec2-related protein
MIAKYRIENLKVAKLGDFLASPSQLTPKNQSDNLSRLLSKLASEEEVIGDPRAKDRSVLNVREDPSTGATKQFPSEVEFRKKSSVISEISAIVHSMKPTIRGMQVTLDEVRVKKIDQLLPKIKISIPLKYLNNISPGDKIELLARLFSPKNTNFLSSSNAEYYSYFAGISATGYAMSKANIITNSKNGFLHQIRMNIYQRLTGAIGPINGNIAAAILLGETKGINKDVLTDMRQSGISHILCVSGLHLTLVAMIVFGLSRFLLNLSDSLVYSLNIKTVAAITSIIGSYLYWQLSGTQIAATRAFIMTIIFILGIIIQRNCMPMRSLGAAAVILLIFTPEVAFHPSFQLSFIAVISLIGGFEFYQNNKSILDKTGGIISAFKFYLVSNIYSSFLASIITAPVVINQFYIFSTYSVITNLIAVPIMSFCLMPLLLLSILVIPIGIDSYIIRLAGFFIKIITNSAKLVNGLPSSVWYFGHITSFSIILFLLGFFWIVFWKTKWRIAGLGIMLISFVFMILSPKPNLIIIPENKTIIYYDKKSKPIIYSDNISTFKNKYIANWFGSEEAEVRPLLNMSNLNLSDNEQLVFGLNKAKIFSDDSTITVTNKGESKVLNLGSLRGTVMIFCSSAGCILNANK